MPQDDLKRFFISIVLPSILAILLFILAIFVVILPSSERNFMEGKKEMISELTKSVCSLLDEYQQERSQRVKQETQRKIEQGEYETFVQRLLNHPVQVLVTLAFVLFILYLSIMPFLEIGRG
jgi:predicted PurR-regulated permease PerM